MMSCPRETMPTKSTEHVQLRVPGPLKKALALAAARDGTTIRVVVLRALAEAGFDVPKEELQDKRKS